VKAYRIGSRAHPIFDGRGAALFPGRWNGADQRVIYCGASFAISMLERLCYMALGKLPAGDLYVEIEIPDKAVEFVDADELHDWDSPDSGSARSFGSRWWRERRSVALSVPSAVTRLDRNIVINEDHPEFWLVAASDERPVVWDRRLFIR
jgi:RES domain-containing protein